MEYGPPPLFRQGIPAKARFVLLTLFAIVLILVDGRLRALDDFRGALMGFIAPLQSVVDLPAKLLSSSANYFVSKTTLKLENDRLTEENYKMALEVSRLREMQLENERLRALVSAVPRMSNKVRTAEVIGRVPDRFTHRLQINIGEKEGLLAGMAAISAYGVLGQVSRVIAHHAEVTLITDNKQQLAVMNERTKVHYILAGTGEDLLDLLFVPSESDIQQGDRIVTSGLDSIFPAGIAVGEVVNVYVEPGEIYKHISVRPFATMENAQFVTVILRNPDPTRPLEEDAQKNKDRLARRSRS